MQTPVLQDPRVGFLQALAGFTIWGLFPLYFKALEQVLASEILAHRILWSALLLGLFLALAGRLPAALRELGQGRRLGFYLLTTAAISTNWLVYIWAVHHDQVLEASLGYYINPLVSVLLAVLFLGERLTQRQGLAVALAAVGVLALVAAHGVVPWVSLVLAFSFGSYGLLRKKAQVNASAGLFLETLLAAPLALAWLALLAGQGRLALGAGELATDLLLAGAGLVTVAPLALFLSAMQSLKLSTIGLTQYITPTLQFLLAVLVFDELFLPVHAFTFGCIWVGLALFSSETLAGAWRARRR